MAKIKEALMGISFSDDVDYESRDFVWGLYRENKKLKEELIKNKKNADYYDKCRIYADENEKLREEIREISESCKNCPVFPAFVLLVENYNASLKQKTKGAK